MARKRSYSKYSTIGRTRYEIGGHVLKNLLGIRKKHAMERTEYDAFLKTQKYYYRLFTRDRYPVRVITASLVKEIHKRFLGGIYGWAGQYRRETISKEGIPFPPAFLPDGTANIPRLMTEWEDMVRSHTPRKGDPVPDTAREIAIIHGEFEMIHPFREGNGRVGRLIVDLIALRAGYPPLDFNIEAKPENKARYYAAMRSVFIEKKYSPLARIIEEAMDRGIERARRG